MKTAPAPFPYFLFIYFFLNGSLESYWRDNYKLFAAMPFDYSDKCLKAAEGRNITKL